MPRYAGVTLLETRAEPTTSLHKALRDKIGRGMGLFLAGPSRIIVQRQGDDSYRIYFGITAPEHFTSTCLDLHNRAATRQTLLRDFFSDWSEELRDYICHADNFRSWPLYQLPAEGLDHHGDTVPVPGITLVGDAAHLSVPNGEGVNIAMTDAMELASKIEEYGVHDIETAVREYEKEMLVRGKEHIQDGENMEQMMTHPGGAKALVEGFVGGN
jgi:2-polyprenyl-6-methoxyphenol hydroxylase-like FAD-dependent oxidoreductase